MYPLRVLKEETGGYFLSTPPPLLDTLPRHLLDALKQFPSVRRYWVAYSGGRDSSVLLHALAALRPFFPADLELRAMHVDHGLSPRSGEWSRHCESACIALGMSCQVLCVNAKPQSGESPEAAARHARYQAIATFIEAGDVLLTAHHQDDQAETLLLQLLRGAGPHGLAAMPAHAPFSRGLIVRPLLNITHDAVVDYADQHGLVWVEDHSNFDTGFERNYLRHDIMPHLRRRWPAAATTLSRAAAHAAEAADLLDALADADLQQVRVESDVLSVTRLLALDAARQRNVLRRWFKRLDLPAPATVHTQHIQSDILHAAQDSVPCVHWAGAEVRRYRDSIYAMRPLAAHDASTILTWDMSSPLALPGISTLTALVSMGAGIKAALCQTSHVTVRFRQGGERCRPAGRGHSHALKNLFQEQGIPSWQRDRLPLIYIGDELAAVADLWVCEPFQATQDEAGIVVQVCR